MTSKIKWIYYLGPTPNREVKRCKLVPAFSPTTSSRMDKYAPTLLDLRLKGMIGKGKEVLASLAP